MNIMWWIIQRVIGMEDGCWWGVKKDRGRRGVPWNAASELFLRNCPGACTHHLSNWFRHRGIHYFLSIFSEFTSQSMSFEFWVSVTIECLKFILKVFIVMIMTIMRFSGPPALFLLYLNNKILYKDIQSGCSVFIRFNSKLQ